MFQNRIAKAISILSLIAIFLASGAMPGAALAASSSAPTAHSYALVRGLDGRAWRVADRAGVGPLATSSPTGLDPATIKAAYNFPTALTAGTGKTIAIVDAFDDPTAEADLGVFSSQYGLPACTTANGCFKKVNQTGGSTLPPVDAGWALEISLDIQWAHAIAPGAHILLVEATSNSFANLLAAEDYAKTHAQYVSNSWGSSREFSGETSYDSHFSQSGVSFFVSAGDSGATPQYPSVSPNVISVGGTLLKGTNGQPLTPGGTFGSESGWSGGGGGCSRLEKATSAQLSFSGYANAGCKRNSRATPDVSLDADPNSGVSVYDSTPYNGSAGWFQVGGTSASAPMWAARASVTVAVVNAAYVYGTAITYRDITTGSNGQPCKVGFDLCTGRGSWTGQTP